MPERDSRPEPARIDRFLSVLASSERRAIIAHLHAIPEATASLEELAAALATHTGLDREQASTRLHHAHLPKLAATSSFEYDAHSGTVRYNGHAAFESLLEAIQRVEAGTPSR